MTTALVPANGQASPPAKSGGLTLQHLEYIAQCAYDSKNFGRDKIQCKASAVMLILAGQSMGIDPYVALTEINMIEGKPTLSANLMRALVLRSGDWDVIEVEKTATRCELHWLRKDGGKWVLRGKSIWTIERAKTANLLKGHNWQKYPEAMLLARATTEGFKAYCPHLVGGVSVYTPDELRDEPKTAPVLRIEEEPQDAEIVTDAEKQREKAIELSRLIEANRVNLGVLLTFYHVKGVHEMSIPQLDKAIEAILPREAARVAKEKHDATLQSVLQSVASDDGMPVPEPVEASE